MARLTPSTHAQARRAAESFNVSRPIVDVEAHQDGLIHETYLVTAGNGERFVLQRVNEQVFPHPQQVAENTDRILRFLDMESIGVGASRPRRVPELVRTPRGESFYNDGVRCWRLFRYIENTYTVQSCPTAMQGQQIGEAFGSFLDGVAGFPGQHLHTVLPGYRDTKRYFDGFRAACRQDPHGRSFRASKEISIVEKHTDALLWLQAAGQHGKIPKRIIHGDTKLNNVLLDKTTHAWVCVIDLDTVMEGTLLQDLGDCIREALSGWSQEHDCLTERDLVLFRAIVLGFRTPQRLELTPLEERSLPAATLSMALELGIRFLTDFILGDRYFRAESPDDNLHRARRQLRLACRLARSARAMAEAIHSGA